MTAIHELPPEFVVAQLEAVFSDIGVDAAKTGMLFSRALIETVAGFLERHPVPLVVDPVMVASSGAKLLEDDAVELLVGRLFPLATVVTPNLPEAVALAGFEGRGAELAERLHELGAPAVIVTGGHGETPSTTCLTAREHLEIPVEPPRHRGDARCGLHPLGHARRAARARAVARGGGARRCSRGVGCRRAWSGRDRRGRRARRRPQPERDA